MAQEDDTDPTNLYETVVRLLTDRNWKREDAIDALIVRLLRAGDPDGYIYFETRGHLPGRKVLRLLSVMLTSEVHGGLQKALDAAQPDLGEFWFQPKRRDGKAGRRQDELITMRDELIAINVHVLVKDGLSIEAAAEQVAVWISEPAKMHKGRSVKTETVIKAYKKHRKCLEG